MVPIGRWREHDSAQLQPPRIAPLSCDWTAVRILKLNTCSQNNQNATKNTSKIEIFGRNTSKSNKLLPMELQEPGD